MSDTITPGSLPARVLAHMLNSRTESAPDELAAELEANAIEVRHALGSLRRMGKVLQRLEDGKAVYRLPDAAHMRIPGSSLQVIPSPLELRGEPKPGKRAKAAAAPTTPKEPPMTDKPPVKPGTDRARMLELVTQEPGLTGRDIAKRLGLEQKLVTLQLQQLKERGLIVHANGKKPFEWKAADGKRADASTPKAEKAPRAKPRRAKPAAKAKNLAEIGAATTKGKAPKAVRLGGAIEAPALAIDADGIVAIEDVKLSPKGIQSLVAFLEKTQHVWQGAAA